MQTKKNLKLFGFIFFLFFSMVLTQSESKSTNDPNQYWMKIRALDKFERSVIANIGVAIEGQSDDYVIAYGSAKELERVKKTGWLIASTGLITAKDFPTPDKEYHNYQGLTAALQKLANENPDIVALDSIGKSTEGRDLWHVRFSTHLETSKQKPGVIFLGGHHAREHLSIDTPLRIAENLIKAYRDGDLRAKKMLEGREIHFIPCVNPDGAEYDISGSKYKMWRKNRKINSDGTYGVDLNRNYGYEWGTGGSSKETDSDVYMGPQPFSEPETQAVRDFIHKQTNLTTLLSFHTFSELILYPWGHSYNPIADEKARQTHEIMAKKMAEWNNYTPQQASELYIASGDTTDWSYGVEKIISFTFELDPQNNGSGWGFYPGAGVIPEVVRKNTEPVYYLIEHADNPYRAIDEKNKISLPPSPVEGLSPFLQSSNP